MTKRNNFNNRTPVTAPRIKPKEGKITHVEEEWRRAKVGNWANSAMKKIPMLRPAPKRLPPMRLAPLRRPIIRTGGLLSSVPRSTAQKQIHGRGLLNLK